MCCLLCGCLFLRLAGVWGLAFSVWACDCWCVCLVVCWPFGPQKVCIGLLFCLGSCLCLRFVWLFPGLVFVRFLPLLAFSINRCFKKKKS